MTRTLVRMKGTFQVFFIIKKWQKKYKNKFGSFAPNKIGLKNHNKIKEFCL